LISFFVLGGILGALGSVFQINATVSSTLGIIVALVMLLLGIDLLGVFQFQKKFQPSLPKSVSKRALGVSRFGGLVASFFIGVSTFFLPCGFTQSMQVYALSTGNFWQGAVTMFTFALGTLPALAAISFGAWSIGKSEKAGVFFKTAGIIVVLFAIFNLVNSLAAMGVIRPIFNI
jgi:sulfite exporter TauE/SafE